jgi:ribosome-associated translation inhibitor RaiA
MYKIVFKNLESSDLVRTHVEDRMESLNEKFPDLKSHRGTVTLEMKNSPTHAGPDLFSVKAVIDGFKYKDITFEHNAENLYLAIAEFSDRMVEVLNRAGDKIRVKARSKNREASEEIFYS